MNREEVLNQWHDPWWYDHLEWLLENRPNLVKELFEKDPERLAEHLSRVVVRALRVFTSSKLPDQEASDRAFELVIAPEAVEDPPDPLPEELQEEILAWAENYGLPEDQRE
jgi:hypothetical protein